MDKGTVDPKVKSRFERLRQSHSELLRATAPARQTGRTTQSIRELTERARTLLLELNAAALSLPRDLRHFAEIYALHWAVFIFDSTGEYPEVPFVAQWASASGEPHVEELTDIRNGEATLQFQDGSSSRVLFTAPDDPPLEQVAGRAEQYAKWREQLADGRELALWGASGVGKTTLALHLVHDPELLTHFPDGVLWMSLGKDADCYNALGSWCAALGLTEAEVGALTSISARQQEISRLIGAARMLLVIDDAWTVDDARALRCGGPYTGYLLTAYEAEVAAGFVGGDGGEGAQAVAPFGTTDGFSFLRSRITGEVDADPDAARELVVLTAGSPLALELIASSVRAQMGPATIDDWRQLLRSVSTSQPSPNSEPPALAVVVEAIVEVLPPDYRHALRAVSLLEPKPNSVTRGALDALAGGRKVVDRLISCGLIQRLTRDRWTIHRVVVELVRAEKPTPLLDDARRRLIRHYVEYIHENEGKSIVLCRDHANLLTAIRVGLSMEDPCDTLLIVRAINALFPYLMSKGLYDLGTQLSGTAVQRARALPARTDPTRREFALQQAIALQNLGTVHQKCGRYAEAVAKLREALKLGPIFADQGRESRILGRLGSLELSRGDYSQASKQLHDGLRLAQGASDWKSVVRILVRLGTLETNRGEFERSEQHNETGLQLARRYNYPDLEAALLLNLGVLAFHRGDYTRAEEYDRQGLEVLHNHPDRECETGLLQALGGVAIATGQLEDAEHQLAAALDLAQQIRHPWYEALVQKELGELNLKRGLTARAMDAFTATRQFAEQLRSPDLLAYAHYGMARAAAMRREDRYALRLAEKSLREFERIGHFMAPVVRVWCKRQEKILSLTLTAV